MNCKEHWPGHMYAGRMTCGFKWARRALCLCMTHSTSCVLHVSCLGVRVGVFSGNRMKVHIRVQPQLGRVWKYIVMHTSSAIMTW